LVVVLIAGGLTSAQSRKQEQRDPPVVISENNRQPTPPADGDYVVSGQCVDEEGHPLKDVRVRLFQVGKKLLERKLISDIETDSSGRFRFAGLPEPIPVEEPGVPIGPLREFAIHYAIVVTKQGRASRIQEFTYSDQSTEGLSIQLRQAAELSGRVTDKEGNPIKNAQVFARATPRMQPVDGVLSTVTDADGRYSISDMASWAPQVKREGKMTSTTQIFFTVLHPGYGMARPTYTQIPSQVDVTLEKAAILEGRVFDKVTGQPAANAKVSIQGVSRTDGFGETRTNPDGTYRMTAVNAGTYNITAHARERTCVALDSVSVEAGKTYPGINLELIEGSWIEGRIVDAVTGKPLSSKNLPRLSVGAYGPARPKSGAAVTYSPVDENGRFALRVAPGKNYPYIMTRDVWQRTQDREKYQAGIDVGEGELVVLNFRVLDEAPPKRPKLSPVHLPIPVPEEREAAAAIRRLGGWYEVDENKRVVEVNMVFHYESENTDQEVRYNNDQTETDKGLRWVKQFPELKRLFLKKGQATDEGLKHLVGLKKLEVFYAWDAHHLSDAGVRHLSGLKILKNIHISNSKIGDGALKVFSQLPNVERLSLQGNEFTDAGVPHLKNLTSLKSLWMGLGKSAFTDEACDSLGEMTSLEELSLQRCAVTDAGIRKLSQLTGLKKLYLGGTDPDEPKGITDESVGVLTQFGKLESLMISKCRFTDEGTRKLAALPDLKQLSLSGSAVTRETIVELKEKYPEIWINITDR
jgi:5-hydroxyisourate hydrolase-like protein (transthyretin family)